MVILYTSPSHLLDRWANFTFLRASFNPERKARRARSAARTKYVHPMPFICGMFIITHITHVSVYMYISICMYIICICKYTHI